MGMGMGTISVLVEILKNIWFKNSHLLADLSYYSEGTEYWEHYNKTCHKCRLNDAESSFLSFLYSFYLIGMTFAKYRAKPGPRIQNWPYGIARQKCRRWSWRTPRDLIMVMIRVFRILFNFCIFNLFFSLTFLRLHLPIAKIMMVTTA